MSKVADFNPVHLSGSPVGVTPVEFRGDFLHQKTRLPGLSCGIVCVIPYLAISVEVRLVTDGRTQGHSIASIASRGKITDKTYDEVVCDSETLTASLVGPRAVEQRAPKARDCRGT